MLKTLTAALTALSLTLTSAAPLHAQETRQNNADKLMFGLLAAAVLGVAINNSRERRERAETQVHDRSDRQHGMRRGQDRPRANQDHDRNLFEAPRVRPDRQRVSTRRNLPRECLRSIHTRYGETRMFTRRCLTRNYIFHGDLPQQCSVRVFTDRGARRGYDPHCLRDFGFRARR